MKTKLHYIFVLSIVGVIAMIIINSKYDFTSLTISEKRKIHQEFLKNSPFKETLNLSKSERKAIGLPPNKYYEREWELTMNPATGKPEPFKVLDFQKKETV